MSLCMGYVGLVFIVSLFTVLANYHSQLGLVSYPDAKTKFSAADLLRGV